MLEQVCTGGKNIEEIKETLIRSGVVFLNLRHMEKGSRNRYLMSIRKQNKHKIKQLHHKKIYRETVAATATIRRILQRASENKHPSRIYALLRKDRRKAH